MAVVIRLSRHGRKKKPFYRIVAADQRFSRDGRFLEILGTYDPASKVADVKQEAAKMWIRKGARLTPTVTRILAIPAVSTTPATPDATANEK